MKRFIYNTGYFLREAKTIFRMNLLSNIFSLLSTGLIFFLLALILSGWWISSQMIKEIQGEAEISIYLADELKQDVVLHKMEEIKLIEGIKSAVLVSEEEAYDRMVKILGKEAQVLAYFEDNPFGSFIEVRIDLNQMDEIITQLEAMASVEHIRDNREILVRLKSIADVSKLLGYLVVAAVGISTLVIISHMIRQGIYNNREQMNTLQLLGAPEDFIALPFLIEGVMLTLFGGLLAIGLAAVVIKQIYLQMAGPLPFIPLPSLKELLQGLSFIVLTLSVLLGILGSLFGLSSSKNR